MSARLPPRQWPQGRLSETIGHAKRGDHEAGRELLSMAAMQLREFGEIEPDLVSYLAEVLLEATRHPASDVAHHLNIAPPAKPSNRPADDKRSQLMLLYWRVACEQPAMDRGDKEYIRTEAARIMKLEDEEERYRRFLDLHQDEYLDAIKQRTPTESSTFDLAAGLFNHALTQAHEERRRLDEKPVTGGAIRSAVYRHRKKFSEVPE